MNAPDPVAEELEALSQRVGLATRYHDFYGNLREVPREALIDALQAMGALKRATPVREALHEAGHEPPEETSIAETALLAVEADPSQSNVVVLREGQPLRFPVAAPGGLLAPGDVPAPMALVRCEDGSVLRGRIEDGHAIVDGLPMGYHQFTLSGLAAGAPDKLVDVIVCPERAWQPKPLAEGSRWWGACVQVYALRSRQNWGVGDFSDLGRLASTLAAQGAAFIGLNPLHALFLQRPHEASPYSPSSRNALNVLYLDIEAMPDFNESREARQYADRDDFRRRIDALRETEEVDWPGVAAIKLPMLARIWEGFRARHLDVGSPRARELQAFMAANPHLARHALYEAVQAHLSAQDPGVWGWPAWPEEWRDPEGAAIREFAASHEERVAYYGWLQWQADLQLAAAQARARAAGMPLGLYRDLAVGANEGGSEVWSRQDDYALGLHVGAPPDPLNAMGQNWGLPPLNPARLAASRFQGFIEMVRANMRHAGALRLDHVMGLMRLFWIGEHGGTYVSYPQEALLGILALESRRNHCMVIGEDLGNVAPSMREAMRERAVLSYCPLYFERGDGGTFKPPGEWRPLALAVVSTHDLPTLAGWWLGEDIELSARLSLYPDSDTHTRQVLERAQGRVQLLIALEREGLLPEGATIHPTSIPEPGAALVYAVHAFLARTPSMLVGVQLEDITGQRIQVNVPGTMESQYPNWRRKLPVVIEDLAVDPRMQAVADALSARRPAAEPEAALGLQSGAAQVAADVPAPSTALVPQSTYRVQLHAGFTFEQATRVVPYLAALGISHLYASPWQKARAGSTHGYDVVDHNALNPELGDEASFDQLCSTLSEHGMQQMLDIVPNHMGVLEADNAWWLDVLEHGAASLHAETFDIDWNPRGPGRGGRVLLPVLGDHYGRVLEAGELKLVFEPENGSFHVGYYDHRFPIDPRDYPSLLQVPASLPEEERARVESLLHAFEQLPERSDTSASARATRARDARLLKRSLAKRVAGQPLLADWVRSVVDSFNGTAGQPATFDPLDALIARQAWRVAYWRVAGDEINYRRFFDVNTLAALRMDREQVFEATHRRVLRWLQDGCVAALRIDHPDGLSDPRAYFERLQARQAQAAELAGLPRRAIYLVVEKILSDDEDLPADWPVHGGTGYRFANLVNGLFVDAAGESAMTRIYSDFTGADTDFDEVVYEAKRLIMDVSLGSDLQWLADTLLTISRADRRTCDFTQPGLRQALAEVAAGFSVYRTYLTGDGVVSDVDRHYFEQAMARARRRGVAGDVTVLDHIRNVLLSGPLPDAAADATRRAFISRWQQFTAPVMAKSMEDTAFYRFHRLISLNDVGGDPRNFGTEPSAFHAVCESQGATRPHWLLGTSTHDSKRSEDVRTRLDVLSEMPSEWSGAVQGWHALADRFARQVDGVRAPSLNDEYLLYQTLTGVWPLAPTDAGARESLKERVNAYMLKAIREAKQETSWINPNDAYEQATADFIDGLFSSDEFIAQLEQLIARIAAFGLVNSLNMVVLKLTTPGVPDIYQGCEQWNFSLVDPDNRRPVDFDVAASNLQSVQALYGQGSSSVGRANGFPAPRDWALLRSQANDGRIKLLVTWRLLQLRRAYPEFFAGAGYVPLSATGAAAGHVLGYARTYAGTNAGTYARTPSDAEQVQSASASQLIVATSRLAWGRLGGDVAQVFDGAAWVGTKLPLPGDGGEEPHTGWRDWFTGRSVGFSKEGVAVSELFAELPFAVLVPSAWMEGPSSP